MSDKLRRTTNKQEVATVMKESGNTHWGIFFDANFRFDIYNTMTTNIRLLSIPRERAITAMPYPQHNRVEKV